MGTRFIATKEAPVHENVKQALVDATELDTRLDALRLRVDRAKALAGLLYLAGEDR